MSATLMQAIPLSAAVPPGRCRAVRPLARTGVLATCALLALGGLLAAGGCGSQVAGSQGGGSSSPSPTGQPTSGEPGSGGPTSAASYADPAGDIEGSGPGPDITAVVVSGGAEAVTFAVTFAADPPLAFDQAAGYTDMIMIPVTTPGGDSYVIGGHAATLPGHVVVRRCPAGRCTGPAGQPDLAEVGPAAIEGATVRITVPRAVLDDPERFTFFVAAGREGEVEGQGAGDRAPSSGTWTWPRPTGRTPG